MLPMHSSNPAETGAVDPTLGREGKQQPSFRAYFRLYPYYVSVFRPCWLPESSFRQNKPIPRNPLVRPLGL